MQNMREEAQNMQRKVDSLKSTEKYSERKKSSIKNKSQKLKTKNTSVYHLDKGKFEVIAIQLRCTSKSVE